MKLPLTHLLLAAPKPSKQLMVVLHGLGDSLNGFLWIQDALGFDSLDYLLLNAPTPYYSGFQWYDIYNDSLAGVVQSRKLLAEVLATTASEGYAPEDTFMLGFSQGCLMTLEFGSRHTSRLAGYVGISGYSLDPEAILREMNPDVNHGDWLITHGTQDELLPAVQTRAQMKRLNDGGFNMDYREYAKAHNLDSRRELPDIQAWIQSRLKR